MRGGNREWERRGERMGEEGVIGEIENERKWVWELG